MSRRRGEGIELGAWQPGPLAPERPVPAKGFTSMGIDHSDPRLFDSKLLRLQLA
jgi:hypothetical protein